MGLIPSLDTLIAAFDLLPSPIKVLLAIAMAGALVFFFDGVVIGGMNLMTGIDLRPSLTWGGTQPVCDYNLIPQCVVDDLAKPSQAVANTCIAAQGPQCTAILYGIRGFDNETNDWVIHITTEQPTSDCIQKLTFCRVSMLSDMRVLAPVLSHPQGLDCSADDYMAKMQAWEDSCKHQGGLYLLDYKIWVFLPLIFYLVVFALQYYSTSMMQ